MEPEHSAANMPGTSCPCGVPSIPATGIDRKAELDLWDASRGLPLLARHLNSRPQDRLERKTSSRPWSATGVFPAGRSIVSGRARPRPCATNCSAGCRRPSAAGRFRRPPRHRCPPRCIENSTPAGNRAWPGAPLRGWLSGGTASRRRAGKRASPPAATPAGRRASTGSRPGPFRPAVPASAGETRQGAGRLAAEGPLGDGGKPKFPARPARPDIRPLRPRTPPS